MVAPVVAAAGVGALGNVVGGLVGGRGAGRTQNSAERSAILSYNLQRNFAQHGIRWRVEDAKRAGLHPLFALGGAGASYTPQSTAVDFGQSYQAMGQGLQRAAAAAATIFERELNQAQLEHLRQQTKTDFALQQKYESEAAGLRQGAVSTKPLPLELVPEVRPLPGSRLRGFDNEHAWDTLQSLPRERVSADSLDPSSTAGSDTMYDTRQLHNGLMAKVPRMSDLSELYTEGGPGTALKLYLVNKQAFGERHAVDVMYELFPEYAWIVDDHSGRAREAWDFVRENVLNAPPQYRR